MKFGKLVVKFRIPILILSLVLMIPSVIGMARTRVNYDLLTYLPEDMDTVIGQNELMKDFHKGAFTFLILENMQDNEVRDLMERLKEIDHVDTVIGCDSLLSEDIPKEMLPEKIRDAFYSDHSTMLAAFFDTGTSEDETMEAVREIRKVAGERCFVSGMTALVIDLRDLCEKEEPVYVGLAVACATAAMLLLLDGFLVPFVFLLSIGMMILLNLGSNVFLGEISYITKALSAVLQLAVTMDYSIFLWHSYNEELLHEKDHKQAMAAAIQNTLTSVLGSSVTTIAGFIALCFMSFTMGRDLGIVMAKGVLLGVLGSVTVLPAMILLLDKPLQKTRHRALIPDMGRFAKGIVRITPVLLIVFAIAAVPAFYGYEKANQEVYYDMGECLPEDMNFVISNEKLKDDYGIASTHMILVDAATDPKDVRAMISEMEKVDGVKYVLGLESVLGKDVPMEMLPESLRETLRSDRFELLLINSEYRPASDEVNAQIDSLNRILKKYDPSGMLIGEAPCMKDMIATTDRDFRIVNTISIVAIFIIILLVEKSLSLPVILIAVIELGIFINLAISHFSGQQLPFIAPICISTIQLGATVDYAILMTTRYKHERISGADRKTAVRTAVAASVPSVLVSGIGLFAATFGVALYSNIDIVSSMCMLLSRGALISMVLVSFLLPALLLLCDPLIIHTTLEMTKLKNDRKSGAAALS